MKAPSTILLAYATAAEAAPLLARQGLQAPAEGSCLALSPGLTLLVCGGGLVSSGAMLGEALERLPDCALVLNPGIAGALDAHLRPGSVHLCRSFDLAALYAGPQAEALHGFTRRCYPPLGAHEPGPLLLSSLLPLWDGSHAAALAAAGGSLVDMEGYALAAVCERRRIPFWALKAVSDRAGRDAALDFPAALRAAAAALDLVIARLQEYLKGATGTEDGLAQLISSLQQECDKS